MPVVIKDFDVVGNGQGAGQAPAPAPPSSPAERPLTARQVEKLMKMAKARAKRLHAD